MVSKSTNQNPKTVSKTKNLNPKRLIEVPCSFAVKGVHSSGNHHKSIPDFLLKPVILFFQSLTVANVCQLLFFQSLTVANVCQQFLLKSPRSLNPKMVPETTSINPKMVS
jgi:hypothetical protein